MFGNVSDLTSDHADLGAAWYDTRHICLYLKRCTKFKRLNDIGLILRYLKQTLELFLNWSSLCYL